jgi:hypothetical protein
VDGLGDKGVSRPTSEIMTEQPAEHRPERGRASTPHIRFRVDPADVPAEKAARRLHLTAQSARCCLACSCGDFPPADLDAGMHDLDAIDRWRAARHRMPVLPDLVSLKPSRGNLHAPLRLRGAAQRFVAANHGAAPCSCLRTCDGS